jgi:hypothetical protein
VCWSETPFVDEHVKFFCWRAQAVASDSRQQSAACRGPGIPPVRRRPIGWTGPTRPTRKLQTITIGAKSDSQPTAPGLQRLSGPDRWRRPSPLSPRTALSPYLIVSRRFSLSTDDRHSRNTPPQLVGWWFGGSIVWWLGFACHTTPLELLACVDRFPVILGATPKSADILRPPSGGSKPPLQHLIHPHPRGCCDATCRSPALNSGLPAETHLSTIPCGIHSPTLVFSRKQDRAGGAQEIRFQRSIPAPFPREPSSLILHTTYILSRQERDLIDCYIPAT